MGSLGAPEVIIIVGAIAFFILVVKVIKAL